jgi:predicted RNA-binding Zn ribbon-like protein
MIKLDDNLLQELNLGVLSPEEKKKMLAHIYETLEMRVGMELAKQMTDAQLNEFEEFINRNDEAGALRWLETNFPNYKDVVAAEFDKLKAEIRQVAPQIIASSQQQAQAQQQAQSMAGADPMMPPQRPQYPPQMPPQGGYQAPQSRDDYDLAA